MSTPESKPASDNATNDMVAALPPEKRSCADHEDCDEAMRAEIIRGGTFLHHPPKEAARG